MNRQPRVVDVVRAVQRVAPAYPDVRCFWYEPARRVGPDGTATGDGTGPTCAIVIEVAQGSTDASMRCETIARDLGALLENVSVRLHRGALAEENLIRLVSDAGRSGHNGVALS